MDELLIEHPFQLPALVCPNSNIQISRSASSTLGQMWQRLTEFLQAKNYFHTNTCHRHEFYERS